MTGRIQGRAALAALIPAVLGCVPAPAAAQSLPWQIAERAPAGWTVTPGASFGAAWDSGINTSRHPVFEALFQKWVGRVSPQIEIDLRGRRTSLQAGYSGTLEKFWGSSTPYEQHSRFSVSRALAPRLAAAADFGYSAAPTTDRLLRADAVRPVADALLPFVNIDATFLTTGGSVEYRASPRVVVDGALRFHRMTLDHDPSRGTLEILRDGHSLAPSAGVMRAFTPRLSIGARGEYRREVVGAADDFDVRSLTGVFTYRASRTVTVSAGGGPSWLGVRGSDASVVAPTLHAGFVHERRWGEISGAYERAFRPLYGFGSLAVTDAFSAGAAAPLQDRRSYLSTLVAYSRSRPIEGVQLGFDLDSFWASAAAGRRVAPWLNAELYVTVSRQTSVLRGTSNRTRAGVQFVTSKPVRMQ